VLNRKEARNTLQKGFTLIELLITVVILGTLSSVAVPGFIAQKNRADISAANAQGKALMSACKVGVSEGQNVADNLIGDKKFGKLTWTGVVAQNTDEAPTGCSSTTAGLSTPDINQNFILDVATGNMSTEIEASEG
jgi:type IV pilus assembly protein PilA